MSVKNEKKAAAPKKEARQGKGRLEAIEGADYFSAVLLIIAAAIVPLIVYMHPIRLSGVLFDIWTGEETVSDFFNYNKAQVTIVLMVLMLVVLFYRLCFKKDMEKLPVLFIPFGAYYLFTLLSTLFSDYRSVALSGFTDRFEGMYVLLAYGFITLFSYLVGRYEKLLEIILIAIFASSVIIAVLGLTQFYGVDFFQTGIGRRLILPSAYYNIADSLDFKFADQAIMYTTVYNPNYLGSYAALLLPVSIGFYYLWARQGGWKLWVSLLFCASVFVLFLGGMSRAGLLGGGFAMLVFIVFFRKRILKQLLHSLLILAVFMGIYVTMDLTSSGIITNEVKETLPSRLGFGEKSTDNTTTTRSTYLKELTVNGKELRFVTESESLIMKNIDDTGSMNFLDAEGNVLTLEVDGSVYKIDDERYELYRIAVIEGGIIIIWDEISLPVKVQKDGLYIHYRDTVLLQELTEPESFGFEGLESFASNRGYIWSRSLPIFKDTFFVGHGPDTYALYFPQHDIRGKINYMQNPTVVVDKPHNWYIQMGINTGVISLLAMLVFLGWIVIKGTTLWFKQGDDKLPALGSSIICGIVGYCIASLFNDSVVAVAPVFWLIVGFGLALIFKYNEGAKRRA